MRRLVPAVAGHCVGALVSRRDGFAEPYWTTRAFCAKAVQLGATLMEHSSVTAIEPNTIFGAFGAVKPSMKQRSSSTVPAPGAIVLRP